MKRFTYSLIYLLLLPTLLRAQPIVQPEGADPITAPIVAGASGGAAATATALAANGANCSAGQAPRGVDASGAAENCTAYQPVLSGLTPGNLPKAVSSSTLGDSGIPMLNTRGLQLGPNESDLPALIQGDTVPSSLLVTSTAADYSVVGVESATTDTGIALGLINPGATEKAGFVANTINTSTGRTFGFYAFPQSDGVGGTGDHYDFYAGFPVLTNGAMPVNQYQFYSPSINGQFSGNGYYFWANSRGVFRIKEDNTFNSVGQAIPTLYNPLFAQYTPGATDYERIVQQWNTDVAEIGAEKGGTGTLRALRLLGASYQLASLTSNGFVKTSGGNGALSIDTNTYVVSGGAGGTPSSLTLTNAMGLLPAGVTGTAATLAGSEALTGKTYNGLTITTTTGGLTVANGKTPVFNNSMTFTGTDSTTGTFPSTSYTVARTDAGQTFTGVNIFTSPKILTDISDTNGNELIKFTATGSAVNEITITNNSTGLGPTIISSGETNVPLTVAGKGTGLTTLGTSTGGVQANGGLKTFDGSTTTGAAVGWASPGVIGVISTGKIGFTSSATAATGAPDTALCRDSAGVLGATTGTCGTYGSFRGGHIASDGTAGTTLTCTILPTQMVIKNGLVTSVTGGTCS